MSKGRTPSPVYQGKTAREWYQVANRVCKAAERLVKVVTSMDMMAPPKPAKSAAKTVPPDNPAPRRRRGRPRKNPPRDGRRRGRPVKVSE